MKKIEFKNNSEPYISAENLNTLQNNIEDAINDKNIITASFNTNYTIATSDTYEKVKLDTSVSVGDKLTLTNDGGIKIGAGISKIKASANINFQTIASGVKNIGIFKNDTNIFQNITNISERTTLVLSPIVFDVKENDIIYLELIGTKNDVIRRSMAFSNITLEVI